MVFSEEDKHVIKFLSKRNVEQKHFKKKFIIKAGLVVDWIRVFVRLIVLELRNIFPVVAVRSLLELLTKLKKLKHLF